MNNEIKNELIGLNNKMDVIGDNVSNIDSNVGGIYWILGIWFTVDHIVHDINFSLFSWFYGVYGSMGNFIWLFFLCVILPVIVVCGIVYLWNILRGW